MFLNIKKWSSEKSIFLTVLKKLFVRTTCQSSVFGFNRNNRLGEFLLHKRLRATFLKQKAMTDKLGEFHLHKRLRANVFKETAMNNRLGEFHLHKSFKQKAMKSYARGDLFFSRQILTFQLAIFYKIFFYHSRGNVVLRSNIRKYFTSDFCL